MTWQPIETAPKVPWEDVIVYCESAATEYVHLAFWIPADQAFGDPTDPQEEGWWTYRNSVTRYLLEGFHAPKFWMPMPEPPK